MEARVETPLQEEIAILLRQSDAVAAALYPGSTRRAIDPAALTAPGIRLLVARIDGRAAGCCALFDRGDGTAEVKRMIVGDAFRRRGVGTALIAGAEREAARLGIGTLLLEVGTRNEEAHAMYRRAGFLPRGAFAPYDATPISRFLEKRLSSPSLPPAR